MERSVDDTHFIPRKLFLNGAETFKYVPKIKVKICTFIVNKAQNDFLKAVFTLLPEYRFFVVYCNRTLSFIPMQPEIASKV